ncbi:Cell division protein FtsX [Thalassocella blandensis]|nr:Cell division protein FtsX [Thalassocella blandensis]
MSRGATRINSKQSPPELSATAVKRSSKGAVQSKTGVASKWSSYLGHHRESFYESLSRLIGAPIQSFMTAAVVAIALALPATLLVALNNFAQLGQSWEVNPKISVFLNVRARATAMEQLIAEIKTYTDVAQVDFLSPEQALQDFQQFSGFGEALSSLEENPLPATIIVTPSVGAMAPDRLRALADKIAASAIVEEVSMDMAWVRRLQELMALGKKVVLALASLLGIGVLLVIGNTIRLAIENRRDEIVVSKLVGGTNSFVRRPFLYSGLWYGLLGGGLACCIVMAGYLVVEPSVARLAALYQSEFDLQGLGFTGAIQLMALSAGLGLCGAWLAVSRHLSDIEPS